MKPTFIKKTKKGSIYRVLKGYNVKVNLNDGWEEVTNDPIAHSGLILIPSKYKKTEEQIEQKPTVNLIVDKHRINSDGRDSVKLTLDGNPGKDVIIVKIGNKRIEWDVSEPLEVSTTRDDVLTFQVDDEEVYQENRPQTVLALRD